jgi:hypothetical protein
MSAPLLRLPIALAIGLAASSCVGTIDTAKPTTTSYLGLIRVVVPPDETSRVIAFDVKAVGLRVGNGFGIGFFDDDRLYVPLDCRTVILVANQSQLDSAIHTVKNMGEDICVALKPQ